MNLFDDIQIKTFKTEELKGKTFFIDSFVYEGHKILFATDIVTGDKFVLNIGESHETKF